MTKKYLLSLMDFETKESAYLYVFMYIAEGTIMQWGFNEQKNEIKKWTVLSCDEVKE